MSMFTNFINTYCIYIPHTVHKHIFLKKKHVTISSELELSLQEERRINESHKLGKLIRTRFAKVPPQGYRSYKQLLRGETGLLNCL